MTNVIPGVFVHLNAVIAIVGSQLTVRSQTVMHLTMTQTLHGPLKRKASALANDDRRRFTFWPDN